MAAKPSRPPATASDSRDRILDAVARILVRDGGDAVTIAAVASEAGVSKGGLFYHFPSKEKLIEGLVQRFLESFDAMMAAAGSERAAATRAYIRSATHRRPVAAEPLIALLGAIAVHPDSLSALRGRYLEWTRRLDDDGISSALAQLVRFTVDGIWLADLLELAPPDNASRREILARLSDLVDAEASTEIAHTRRG